MKRTHLLVTAVWAVVLPSCGRGEVEQQAARAETHPITAGERAVGTSGALSPAEAPLPLDDSSVTIRIQANYFLHQQLKRRRIDVDTRDGVVTLRGEVGSDNERAQALLVARTAPGVERVEDALTVDAGLDLPPGVELTSEPPQPARADDEALTAVVQSRFAEDASLKGLAIEVTAKDGVLLLDGAVRTYTAKQRLLTVARNTDGVVQVIDRIRVEPGR